MATSRPPITTEYAPPREPEVMAAKKMKTADSNRAQRRTARFCTRANAAAAWMTKLRFIANQFGCWPRPVSRPPASAVFHWLE